MNLPGSRSVFILEKNDHFLNLVKKTYLNWLKNNLMKKLIAILALTAFMISCNEGSYHKTEAGSDSTIMDKKMGADTSMNSMSSSSMTSAIAEGTMMMKDAKMMIMKDGQYVLMDRQMTCADGCKVMPNGEVLMKDGSKMMMTEGMTIDKDGHMMDDKGKMMMMDDKMMGDHKMMKDSMKK